MCRRIEELEFAEYSSSPWPKKKRGRGKKAAGLRYEAMLGEELARRKLDFVKGPWIKFRDRNGEGFAQPDFVVITEEAWYILEAKLSQTPAAFEQLFLLYEPLLRFLHPDKDFISLQVCKVLRENADIVEDYCDAKSGSTWHWLT